jgi:hypothetical protein
VTIIGSGIECGGSPLFASGDIAVSLQVPSEYLKAAHEEAEETKDYLPLVQKKALQAIREGDWVEVGIPALRPWGIVVATPRTQQP